MRAWWSVLLRAPEARPLAQQLRLLVVVLRGADHEQGVGAALLADLEHLLRDLVVGGVPGDALPLAALELHRVLEAVRVVGDAVLAHRGALRAVRAEVDRRVEHRLLRTHTPFCTTASIAQPTEQCVHTVRFTSILPRGLVLRLGLADHVERQLRRHGAGADGDARALEESAAIDRLRDGADGCARGATAGRPGGGFAGQKHADLLRPWWCGSSC